MEEKRIIRKIYCNRASGQLLISIPKRSGYKEGDYVEIKHV